MPSKLPNRLPAYRVHRPSGQAVVTLNGRDFYLGPHGTVASLAQYDRLIAEWIAGGRQLSRNADDGDITIVELIARYWAHAQRYYVKNGKATREMNHIRQGMAHMSRLYGLTPAAAFAPKALKTIRQSMVDADHRRQPALLSTRLRSTVLTTPLKLTSPSQCMADTPQR